MQDRETGELRPITAEEAKRERAIGTPVFHVGELVEVNGGLFRVHSFGKKMMVLEGMPATRMIKR